VVCGAWVGRSVSALGGSPSTVLSGSSAGGHLGGWVHEPSESSCGEPAQIHGGMYARSSLFAADSGGPAREQDIAVVRHWV
jgi:hypothetical protein